MNCERFRFFFYFYVILHSRTAEQVECFLSDGFSLGGKAEQRRGEKFLIDERDEISQTKNKYQNDFNSIEFTSRTSRMLE